MYSNTRSYTAHYLINPSHVEIELSSDVFVSEYVSKIHHLLQVGYHTAGIKWPNVPRQKGFLCSQRMFSLLSLQSNPKVFSPEIYSL